MILLIKGTAAHTSSKLASSATRSCLPAFLCLENTIDLLADLDLLSHARVLAPHSRPSVGCCEIEVRPFRTKICVLSFAQKTDQRDLSRAQHSYTAQPHTDHSKWTHYSWYVITSHPCMWFVRAGIVIAILLPKDNVQASALLSSHEVIVDVARMLCDRRVVGPRLISRCYRLSLTASQVGGMADESLIQDVHDMYDM
jgi:hypothetical protein